MAIESSSSNTGLYQDYKASSATALYSGGEKITRVQGAPFDDTVYYRGSKKKLRGTKYDGKLYDADGILLNGPNGDDFYIDDGDSVYVVGSECTADLYYKGTNYSGGLYTGYKPSSVSYAVLKLASITTKDVVALTVKEEK